MKKGNCRICHKLTELNKMNQVKSHTSKYTDRQCNGSFKPPVDRPIYEQPADYQKEEILVADAGISVFIIVYVGGLLTGVLLGYWLF